jgi:hypothetical protein
VLPPHCTAQPFFISDVSQELMLRKGGYANLISMQLQLNFDDANVQLPSVEVRTSRTTAVTAATTAAAAEHMGTAAYGS